ncbi:MAG TPA: hypothetical protein VGE77_02030 [Nocardioides sp.]
MTGVALWLLVVGLCDLGRADGDLTGRVRRRAVTSAGVAVMVVLAVLSDPQGRGCWGWILATLAVAVWVPASTAALALGQVQRPGLALQHGRWRFAAAYGAFLAGLLVTILCGPAMGSPAFVERLVGASVLAGLDSSRLLVVVAVAVAQLATANILVRLLLDLVGVPAHDNEKRLRGGRVLGPMERLLVVGLGAAGNLTGASLVIAAKALLRFPELRAPRAGEAAHGGPSDVTEYFLVGSLASWSVALAGVGLVALA